MKKEQEQEEIEWYKDRIKWLADNCDDLSLLKIVHRFVENLI